MPVIQAAEGEGSGHSSEPQPPPSTAQPTNEEPIPTVVSSSHQKTQTPRQTLKEVTELPQTSKPISHVPDEAVIRSGGPKYQEAMGGSITQTRSEKFETEVYTSEDVTTAGDFISIASPPRVSTAEDISTTKTLVYIRRGAAKDKGKAKMDKLELEQTKPKLQQRQERADIKATIKADEELVQRIQAKEREKYSEAKKERLLTELINQRKRYFTQQRADERRNKPLTQAQHRTYMFNYIKHMGSHTLQQLKRLSFDELKNLFEVTMRRVGAFAPMETEIRREVPELATRSSKRGAEEELD
ncbi:hypothetical protein Tco_0741792 [Tanacetum coccineum]